MLCDDLIERDNTIVLLVFDNLDVIGVHDLLPFHDLALLPDKIILETGLVRCSLEIVPHCAI